MKLSTFNLAAAGDDQIVISRWNDSVVDLDETRSVVELFEMQARARPEAYACVGEQRLSYAELDEASNRLAHYLIGRGVTTNTPVGVYFERSADLLVALLGVFKAGGCYVPLDPQYPMTYVGQILEDARPVLTLSSRALGARLPASAGEPVCLEDADVHSQPVHSPGRRIDARQLAYVMYTSGSTGRPKGVMVPHRQILNWLQALWRRVPFGEGEVVAQKTSTAFAISVKELLAGLLAGVPQLFIDETVVRDIPALVHTLSRWRVSRLYTFPAQLQALLAHVQGEPQVLQALHTLFVSIEPCPVETLERLQALMPWSRAWYIYGCTEINDMTYCDPGQQSGRSGFVPIGRPIANTRVFVLDEQMRTVPVGVMGELYVESIGMAHGYWHQPGLTAERFVANPFGRPGTCMYKTGDMGRYLEDGSLEFLGRRDHEVKIRGYRVDLRQIEKVVGAHEGVREAAVVGWASEEGSPQLLTYLVMQEGQTHDTDQMRRYLGERLPTYMVPTLYAWLPALPRLPNGKLDWKGLPAPDLSPARVGHVAPRTPTEVTLATLWAEVLSHASATAPTVGVTDNFFDLGGHSLLATQLFSRIRQVFEIELSINTLFETPVLEEFAHAVDLAMKTRGTHKVARIVPGTRDQVGAATIVPLQPDSEKPKLFCIHPIGGDHSHYEDLAAQLAGAFSVHAVRSDASSGFQSLRELATHYADLVRAAQPRGTYRVLGWSSGGLLALALGEALEQRGNTVDYVALIDTKLIPRAAREGGQLGFFAAMNIIASLRKRGFTMEEVDDVRGRLHASGWDANAFEGESRHHALAALAAELEVPIANEVIAFINERMDVTGYHLGLLAGYEQPMKQNDRVFAYVALESARVSAAMKHDNGLNCAPTNCVTVDGNHYTILRAPNVEGLAETMLQQARALEITDQERTQSPHAHPRAVVTTNTGKA